MRKEFKLKAYNPTPSTEEEIFFNRNLKQSHQMLSEPLVIRPHFIQHLKNKTKQTKTLKITKQTNKKNPTIFLEPPKTF